MSAQLDCLKMKRWVIFSALTALVFSQLSCSKANNGLSVSFSLTQVNVVPAKQFSCNDIRNPTTAGTTPTASISTDSIAIPDVTFVWSGSGTLSITAILLYATSPYLSGGGYNQSMDPTDIQWLFNSSITGVAQIPPHEDSDGQKTTVHTRTAFGSTIPCNFAFGGFAMDTSNFIPEITFPATVEVIGVSTDDSGKETLVDTQTTLELTYKHYGPTPTPSSI